MYVHCVLMKSKKNDYKLTTIGNANVGKSSLVERIAKNKYVDNRPSTVGGAFYTFTKEYYGSSYTFQMWDTAGQERFKSLVPMYIKGSKIVLIVFDITDYDSFQAVKNTWFDFADSSVGSAHKILLGNKLDMENQRFCSPNTLYEYAKAHDMDYIECSAKTGHNIEEIVNVIIQKALLTDKQPVIDNPSPTIVLNDDKPSWTGCGGNRCTLM